MVPLLSLAVHLLFVFSSAFAVLVSVLTVQLISFCCSHLIFGCSTALLLLLKSLFWLFSGFLLLLKKSLFWLCSSFDVSIQVFVLTFQQCFQSAAFLAVQFNLIAQWPCSSCSSCRF